MRTPPFPCRLLLLVPLALAACAPSLSPLYRDFRAEPVAAADVTADTTVYARLRAALHDAGWEEASPAAPNVVSTAPRQLRDWGLYRITVSLDVAPLGGRHVRVFFHPYRRFITGGRSKIPYLDAGLRRAVLPELSESLEAHGFYALGTPRERDEAETEEG